MIIRRLLPEDAGAFAELRMRGLHERPDAFGASPEDDRSADIEQTRELLGPGLEDAVFGAFESSAETAAETAPLVGVLGLHRATHAKARHSAQVWGMYVAPEARGGGAGAALLGALISYAHTLDGLGRLQLGVGRDNTAARTLYERAGFRGWGVEHDALRVGDQPVDELHMSLRLDEATDDAPTGSHDLIVGHCLCGGVQFEVARVVGPLELCHCTRCRRVSGSAFVAGLMVATDGYRMTRGQDLVRRFSLPVVEVPPPYTTFFCERCGSPVPDPEPEGDRFELPAGLLEGDPGVVAERHIFVEHRAPWFDPTAVLPELDRSAVIRLRFGGRERRSRRSEEDDE